MSDNAPRHGQPASAGRDELNLVDFPIGVLRYQQPLDADGRRIEELVFSVDAHDDDDVGTIVPKKVTIRTSSKYGFPTPKEDELLIGLMMYCRRKNNFTEAKTKFQVSDMLRTLGWKDNGRSRRQLREGLDRLAGVRLKFENSWRSEEGKEYEREFVTGILDNYELRIAKEGDGPDSRETTSIQWSAEVFADIRRGNVKELNTAEYFSLKLPLSRRLYRFIDKHLQPGQWFEMNLLKFATHLGISEKRHIGKIRSRLKRPIRELEELGTLFDPALDADRYHRLGDGDWLIRFLRTNNGGFGQTAECSTLKPTPLSSKTRESKRGREPNPVAERLVKEFYRLWCDNDQHNPSFHECLQAQEITQQYGAAATDDLLPVVVKLMKERFPSAATFGATKTFWAIANQKRTAKQTQQFKKTVVTSKQQEDAERHRKEQERKRQLLTEWEQLDEADQNAIRREVLLSCTDFVRRKIEQSEFSDSLVMLACLNKLEQQRKAA